MSLLILYVSLALGVSFLCSVAEAVLLSISTAYAHLLEQEGNPAGARLKRLKQDVDRPLAAILTLNTIAHTVGAAGAGAQASVVFGSHLLGVFSAVLTFLVLVFSEIIPKTLGAFYWRKLASPVSFMLHWMIILLYPFVMMSNGLTRLLSKGQPLRGLSREEFSVMAELGEMEGELQNNESRILRNLLLLRDMRVKDVMTPRPVLFSLPEDLKVASYFSDCEDEPFSRIPVYGANQDQVTGFVLRSDLISAQVRGERDKTLQQYRRPLPALIGAIDLLRAFEVMLEQSTHMMLVVDEYGGVDGVITMEDIFETLLGMEIVDELDSTVDLQRLARRIAKRKAKEMGLGTTEAAQPPAE
ncbi:HlyC/CorC family transporter [Parahaliea sp. F7430]|uniref:HlyC/CorC family transporter n=1 Tax=Sediminihaliea albiluteola TaxID=2758564 RepID=A0A7W2YIS4_9GAMM|nr:hemolysin family protein [Sediminihaliea albiluteola]MBA6411844.1 HlyC/CorC family transporter [Sediminihaliea albiluteola]